MSDKWQAFKKNGAYYAAGFVDAPADAEQVETYSEPQDNILAAIKANLIAAQTVKTDPYKAAVADGSITLADLVKLLKAKGVI